MGIRVKKRDGRIVCFDSSKITTAIYKAYIEVCPDQDKMQIKSQCEYLTDKIVSYIMNQADINYNEPIDIENIQDWIENCLMDFDKAIAKAFIKERFYKEMEERIVYNLGLRG